MTPNNPRFKTAGVACVLALSTSAAFSQIYSKRGLVDNSTGYLEAYVDGWYRGSGVVARDEKLIYSCGHLVYDQGLWATDYAFHRAYHDRYDPDTADGASPRGFRYFSSYSNSVDDYGPSSARAFSYDFTVYYGNNSFGPAVGWWGDGSVALKSSQSKRIVGYPSEIDYTGANGFSYQHTTDWFTRKAYQERGNYYGFDGVSTGSGNSGGPIFVKDSTNGVSYLAGILVSGSYDSAGIYALNDSSHNMASAALGLKSLTRTFSNTNATLLPDGSSTYVTRKTTASGFVETVTALKFSMSASTPRRGDLDVYLKSPSGRIRWIHKQSTSTADNLVVDQNDYSTTFRGYAANGEWQLKMRDSVSGNRATFNRFSVTVSALSE